MDDFFGGNFWYILPAVLGSIPGVLAFANQRRRNLADEEKNEVEAWRSFVDPLRQRVDDLQAIVEELTDRVRYLEAGAGILTRQIIRLGHVPDWPTVDEKEEIDGQIHSRWRAPGR